MKKCQDCKFSVPTKLEYTEAGRWDNAKCSHPQTASKDPPKYHMGETEGKITGMSYCYVVRLGVCDQLAKLFEARD